VLPKARALATASTNQDQRDAIAAAVTARAHTRGVTELMGEIVVPVATTQSLADRDPTGSLRTDAARANA
jgi:hypothetical protein